MANSKSPVYKGGWQFKDVVRENLEGPIGEGSVTFPDGDRFHGYFHLNYAHIYGPAYAADGRYDFADGSWIEKAWIDFSSDGKYFALHGQFRVHYPDGPDSIAMFLGNKRYGFELVLDENDPRVIEWYADDNAPESRKWELLDYSIDEPDAGCLNLTLKLRGADGDYTIVQNGGKYTCNNYDEDIYEPATRVSVLFPNGDSIDHYGDDLKWLKPYRGYITVHDAAAMKYRTEQWEDGKRVDDQAWKRDPLASRTLEIPMPLAPVFNTEAKVWPDGYIDYGYSWIYEGPLENDRPEGKGVLYGLEGTSYEGSRYEGQFHEGLAHGLGRFTDEKSGISQEGVFVEGAFQEPEAPDSPIILHARHGHKHWSAGGSDHDWDYVESEYEVKLGSLPFIGFMSYKVVRIQKNCITIQTCEGTKLILPGSEVQYYEEIEGREWSDGCVYDGDDYVLRLTWNK